MPDGSMRSSPAAMNFNQMNADMYMNGNGMRPPPSSNPGFPGPQFSQQQMDQMARQQAAGRGMPPGWQPPQGQPQMMGQPQPQQPAPIGTPQTRNTDMPPPQGVPGTTTNGRPASPAAPPTPQTANKAAPKNKKETRDRKVSFQAFKYWIASFADINFRSPQRRVLWPVSLRRLLLRQKRPILLHQLQLRRLRPNMSTLSMAPRQKVRVKRT